MKVGVGVKRCKDDRTRKLEGGVSATNAIAQPHREIAQPFRSHAPSCYEYHNRGIDVLLRSPCMKLAVLASNTSHHTVHSVDRALTNFSYDVALLVQPPRHYVSLADHLPSFTLQA